MEKLEIYCQLFLDYLRSHRNLSENSLINYESDLLHFIKFLKTVAQISDVGQIETRDVRQYLSYMYSSGYARNTIARRVVCLRSFFRYLLQQRAIEKNPMRLVRTPKGSRRLPQFLYIHEINSLLDKWPDNGILGIRDRAMLELSYSSGLRIGEIVRINIGDVNFSLRSVLVKGKGKKERIVPFGRRAEEALFLYYEKARPKITGNSCPDRNEPFFVNYRGKRLTERGVYGIITKYLKEINPTRNLSPHVLRHTFATHLLDGGADLRSVQELLGHARLSSTQIYTHVSGEKIKTVYENAHPRAKLPKE
ncbi:MAG: tyrosine recombinase XerC [Thermacetogeniaceae bacterium]